MVFGGGAFGRRQGPEGGAPGGMSVLPGGDAGESIPLLSPVRGQQEVAIWERGGRFSLDTKSSGSPIPDFQPPAL